MRLLASATLAALLAAAPALGGDFSSKGLLGVARIPAQAKDDQGETLGGFGSGMALVPGSWHHIGNHFTATLAMLPDRGWNTDGTADYRARLQYFTAVLTPGSGLKLTYRKSLLLTDANGSPTTGLDPDGVRPATPALPPLPIAGGHVALDDEAIALPGDGSIWVSDEYGPYIYHYDAKGRMIGTIRPPAAFIPQRKGQDNFSANSPPRGQKYDLGIPDSGRQDNQGFEGMSLTPDRKHLFVINQSALVQDLDPKAIKTTRRHVRLLDYDMTGKTPRLVHEYVVPLPLYGDGTTQGLVAAQSELLALNSHQFLLLCRDSGGGFTAKRDASRFRQVLSFDTRGASDVLGRWDDIGQSVAPLGVLRPDITPIQLTPLLDINDNAQLARFGLHNGAPNDANDLYEKWESLALAPAGDPKAPDDYVLLIGSDNDFITQQGVMAGKPYADGSGADVDTLMLAYRLHLPGLR